MGREVLEATGLVRSYGHVRALAGVDFSANEGEVVAVVGDNGAGKSTLVKVISGSVTPDEGEIRVDGKLVQLTDPVAARRAGIETVYQDLALASDLTPDANVFLGRERRRRGLFGRLGMLDKGSMRDEADKVFRSLSVTVSCGNFPVSNLSGGQQQGIAVARAVMWASRVVLFDEPTAALGVVQTRNVLDLIRRVRDRGIAVVLISHSMPDVISVADRVVATNAASFVTEEAIQLHGGIGFTWDHDCHLYLRRAKFCELLLDAPSDYVDAVVSLEMAHRHE